MAPNKLTPDEILQDLSNAVYITDMDTAPTSPRFTVLLSDKEFAATAKRMVVDKIEWIQKHPQEFASPSGQKKTLNGWARLLDVVEEHIPGAHQKAPAR